MSVSDPSPVPPDEPGGDPPSPPPAPSDPLLRRLLKSKAFWQITSGVATVALGAYLAVLFAPWQEERGQEGADRAKREQLAKDPPVLARVSDLKDEADPDWLLNKPLSSDMEERISKLPPTSDNLQSFTRAVGATEVIETCESIGHCGSRQIIRLTLTGHRMDTVEVTGIEAHIISKQPSTKEGIIIGPHGGGADLEGGIINLDADKPRLMAINQDGKAGAPYFAKRYVTLKNDEVVAFRIEAISLTWSYDWELVLSVVSEGKPIKLTIRSDGKPAGRAFRNSGRIYEYREYRHFYHCEVGTPSCRVGPGKNGYPDEFWQQ
ncbi:hypothetical protein ACH4UT_32790 [Streptomyces sp. NPDC020799]|uniref:hypothetical protein n=1 Tax=Streptomyces sp. NPDC020799 TaxID=3365091 RepID=UPI0037AB9717